MKSSNRLGMTIAAALLATACGGGAAPSPIESSQPDNLVGAWHAQIRFKSGAFAEVTDLQFMYVFNAGGTMTESSNYDGAPPVPPAYGTWKRSGPHQFEARYRFYATKAPANFDAIAHGGGWLPAGHGELVERITLSDDGNSYESTIRYAAFDQSGAPAEGQGDGNGVGTRMGV